ncbi:nucleolar protein 14 homolog [Episyrphus balteatus]|uniref:nucleolar protein 14 homolog n=1 Tax=Episyrphus balteatus TaxID=286459 RepID=UPI0024858D44|nr:nucleolar protein 14 homolog [Episyrphus balteatus]
MAKTKKNKKGNSDNVHAKKAKSNPFSSTGSGTKKINPFEVHINKEKFNILGRTCKHDKGLPGVSRAKAVQKRKQTLGKEFMLKNKSNEFKDRRIGRNSEVINDELLNARFVAEKMSQFKKTSRFNLNDDEVLTHRGQTLEEIEQFRDNRSDDDMDDEDILDANFTKAAHFGGEDSHQDRKTAIEEMIAETKLRKAESAKEKDELYELTNKLDSHYKELIPLVGKLSKPEDIVKPKPDDYDRALREMIFEPRSAVSDRLKSEEELARIEKERLEKLENERLARMRDGESTDEKPNHRSADDLDDGYFAGSDGEEAGTLAYDLNGESLSNDNKKPANEEESDAEKANSEESNAEEESDGEMNNENSAEDESENEENEDEDDDEEDDEEDDDEDALSDLKVSDSESETEEIPEKKPTSVKTKKVLDKPKNQDKPSTDSKLPFAIDMPSNYEELKEILSQHSPNDQGILVERIIKCNHPKLDPKTKEKINKLFAYLLQYINDLFTDASTEDVSHSFQVFDKINPFLYDLIHMNPEKASLCLLDVIQEKYSEYKKNSKSYPGLDTLVFFKIVSNLYTTSDYRHNVVTPCYVFISHILSKARVRTRQDVAMGLFLVTVVLEYSQLSRRFVPSALNFLLGVIYMSLPKRAIENLKIVPPFMSTGPFNKLLAIGEKPEEKMLEVDNLLTAEDLVTTTISVDFKIRALNSALMLTKDIFDGISENIGSNFLAEPFVPMMERINLDIYPKFVESNYEKTMSTLSSLVEKPLKKLVPPEKKPKALRLFEPRIETVYDDKRRPKISKAKEEKVKLIHKIRRETKGAVREIRRDTEFLQKIRIKQQIQSDQERKEKVKRIYQEASVQQGELNELKRQKTKKT